MHSRPLSTRTPKLKKSEKAHQNFHFGVLDIETQRSSQEVRGWQRVDLMSIRCAVLYDSDEDSYHTFLEDQIFLLIEHLQKLDRIFGFNINRFDYRVLAGCVAFNFSALPALDILDSIYQRLGYRLSLNHIARVRLGVEKNADGLQALHWWKEGRIFEIIHYCMMDVKITKDLFLYGKKTDISFLIINLGIPSVYLSTGNNSFSKKNRIPAPSRLRALYFRPR